LTISVIEGNLSSHLTKEIKMPVIHTPSEPTHELPGTSFTSLATPSLGSSETSVWKVAISPGTQPTPHSLTRGEVFLVLRGTAAVRISEITETAAPGDVIVIPADTDFELSNAGAEMLEALCCMPVGGQARTADGQAFTPPWAL
jgi:quercetin dioxygenase-like cupin family protein